MSLLAEALQDANPSVMVAIVTGGLGLLGTIVTAVIAPGLIRHARTVEVVREQVQNSHKTNLRDDIDELRDLIHEVIRGQTQLREDLAIERRERIAGDERNTPAA